MKASEVVEREGMEKTRNFGHIMQKGWQIEKTLTEEPDETSILDTEIERILKIKNIEIEATIGNVVIEMAFKNFRYKPIEMLNDNRRLMEIAFRFEAFKVRTFLVAKLDKLFLSFKLTITSCKWHDESLFPLKNTVELQGKSHSL